MEFKNIPDMASFTERVKERWEILKRQYPERAARMKRAFFLDMAPRIYNVLMENHLERGIDVPSIEDVTAFLFHFHYFYSGHRPDGERAEYQRSAKYKNALALKVTNHLLMRVQSLDLRAVGNEYSPEIACTEGYVDALTHMVHAMGAPVITSQNCTHERYETIRSLVVSALAMAKSILYQMGTSLPSHALISWRSLLELEYKVLVLSMYGGKLTERFVEFGRYELLDEERDADSPLLARFREQARCDGYDIRHQGYKNYGWLLSIEAEEGWKPYPSLKYLFTVAEDPARYEQFRTASRFAHHSAATVKANEDHIYNFLVSEMSRSLQNLEEAIDNLKEQYCVMTEEYDGAVGLCATYHAEAVSQYFVNRLADGDE